LAVDRVICLQYLNIATLLTYGIAFPILGLAVGVTIYTNTWAYQLLIGRYLVLSPRANVALAKQLITKGKFDQVAKSLKSQNGYSCKDSLATQERSSTTCENYDGINPIHKGENGESSIEDGGGERDSATFGRDSQSFTGLGGLTQLQKFQAEQDMETALAHMDPTGGLDAACAETGQSLENLAWLMVWLSSIFFAILLFDVTSDSYGIEAGRLQIGLMIVFPLMLYTFYKTTVFILAYIMVHCKDEINSTGTVCENWMEGLIRRWGYCYDSLRVFQKGCKTHIYRCFDKGEENASRLSQRKNMEAHITRL